MALGADQRSSDWTGMLDSSCRFGAGNIEELVFDSPGDRKVEASGAG